MSRVEAFRDGAQALNIPWVDSPFFERQLAASDASEEYKRLAREFRRDGFAVVEGLFSEDLIDGIVADYERLFDPKARFQRLERKPTILTHDPSRRQDAWTVSDPVKQLACDDKVLDLLRFLYGRAPIPFQTLNFLPGTQQGVHSDELHFSTLPRGFMCGVWVALEDVTLDNGPLLYYPGSHRVSGIRLHELGVTSASGQLADSEQNDLYMDYLQALIAEHGLEERVLTVPKGTALIWSSALLHGGKAIRDPNSTRRSQVTHYYFEDCIYYAPILSNACLGEYRLKPVFDIRTNELCVHSLNGEVLDPIVMRDGRVRFGRKGSFPRTWPLWIWQQRATQRLERFARKRGWDRFANTIVRLGHERWLENG